MKRIIFLIFCAFTMVFVQGQTSKFILTDKAPKPIGPYSQAVFSGNTLYVSGQISIVVETGQLDTTSIENETHLIMKHIGNILLSAGMSYKNVVKVTIFTTDLTKFSRINEIYGQYFKENPPARETVQVVKLPKNVHIEISVIAIK